jgi:hypothetical protein
LAGGEASLDVVKRIKKQPGGKPPSMFTSADNFIKITKVTVLENPTPEQEIIVKSSKLRGTH